MTDQEFRDALEAAQEMCDDPAAYPRSIISEALLHAASLLEQERKARVEAEAERDKLFLELGKYSDVPSFEYWKERAEKAEEKTEVMRGRKIIVEAHRDWLNQERDRLKAQVAEYERALINISKANFAGPSTDERREWTWATAEKALTSRGSKVEELVSALERIESIRKTFAQLPTESDYTMSIRAEDIAREALKAFRGGECTN